MALKNKQIALKPQDLVLLFKLAIHSKEHFTYAVLGRSLGIAASEAHSSMSRVAHARLLFVDENGIRLARREFIEFVKYGAIYSFPAVAGPIARGIPTGYAAPPLVHLINQPDEMPPVWPDSKGDVRGTALYPLYSSVPFAVKGDSALYEILALFDALRGGAARERDLARRLLEERL